MKNTAGILLMMFPMILMMILGNSTAYGYGWGYKKTMDNQPPDIGEYKEVVKKNNAIFRDETDEKVVYLTFDNGYEQGYTEKILDVLQTEKVPATFFVTGHYVQSEPDIVKQMVEDGHIIGNHSYHHPDFTTLSKAEVEKELQTLETAVAEVSTQKEMVYLRPPRGTFNEKTLQWAEEFGYVHVFWSLAFKDWEIDKQKGWKYAYQQIMEQIHPGAVVLLHTVSEDNAVALEKVIQDLKKQGYTFKSLDDFMMKQALPKQLLDIS